VAAGEVHLPLEVVGAGAFVAAAAGDQFGYLLGRRFGPRVFSRPDSRLFSQRHVIRAQTFFERHGPRAVLLARLVPVVRALTPVVAGVGRMPRGRFTLYNLIGAAVWTAGMLVAGFLLGGVSFVADHVELIVVGMVAVSFLPAAAASLHRRRSARPGSHHPHLGRTAS
jgi:membrane protein DedA with SNARE-associated domain